MTPLQNLTNVVNNYLHLVSLDKEILKRLILFDYVDRAFFLWISFLIYFLFPFFLFSNDYVVILFKSV